MKFKTVFTVKQVKRYFDILDRLERSCGEYYKDKDCQRTVFVRRTFKNFHRYWAFQFDEPTGFFASTNGWDSEEIKIPIVQYISIANISYYLGYGQEIQVMYWMAGSHKLQSMKIGHNEALRLKGKKITKEKYNKIASMFLVNEEEQVANKTKNATLIR